jgi:hypothetical protein
MHLLLRLRWWSWFARLASCEVFPAMCFLPQIIILCLEEKMQQEVWRRQQKVVPHGFDRLYKQIFTFLWDFAVPYTIWCMLELDPITAFEFTKGVCQLETEKILLGGVSIFWHNFVAILVDGVALDLHGIIHMRILNKNSITSLVFLRFFWECLDSVRQTPF